MSLLGDSSIDGGRNQSISEPLYRRFTAFLQEETGIILGNDRQYLVESRLRNLMRSHELRDFSTLLDQLGSNPVLRKEVIGAMTTNETSWFRDQYPYRILEEHLLPEFSDNRTPRIRIWSAACSFGQEPYSISMIVNEFQEARPSSRGLSVEILATDLSSAVIEQAASGVFDGMAMTRGMSDRMLQKYFRKEEDGWQVDPLLRRRIEFRQFNLLDDYKGLGRFDVIFCRNVLIYFSAELKSRILNRLAGVLNPGGYLFLGGSESISNYSDAFELVRLPAGVFFRLK